MMMLENVYDIGEVVYLKTDPDMLPRIVTKISAFSVDSLEYQLSCGVNFSYHMDYEITKEKIIAV